MPLLPLRLPVRGQTGTEARFRSPCVLLKHVIPPRLVRRGHFGYSHDTGCSAPGFQRSGRHGMASASIHAAASSATVLAAPDSVHVFWQAIFEESESIGVHNRHSM